MPELTLYNSLRRRVETFVPQHSESVGMYVCGPTVYGPIHIGNARPAVVFDVLFRLLGRRYAKINFVRNITDIDDKIISRASAENSDVGSIAERYIALYHRNLAALQVLPPSSEPRATEYVPDMIRMVERLMSKGFAYATEGHVLFDVTAAPNYGELSGRRARDMLVGARVEVADYKRAPLDFVLWKPSSVEQPGWDSPWGRGRPGWHLECSAMALSLIGETIDIHGGGEDLTFPHHENERVQSCCASGKPEFARYWVHNGHITVAGSKMSKSLGNTVVVDDLLRQHHGEVLRLALLGSHYRKPMDWNKDSVGKAQHLLNYCYQALEESAQQSGGEACQQTLERLESALLADMNTPEAIRVMGNAARLLHRKGGRQNRATLVECGRRLGLLNEQPEEWFHQPVTVGAEISEREVTTLVAARQRARSQRDFAQADRIRQRLAAAGIQVEDTHEGVKWRRQR